MEIRNSQWITAKDRGDVCPVFRRTFKAGRQVSRAFLSLTALGIYEAYLNGRRVSDYVLAPGWTSYDHRLQVQEYDVSALISEENDLRVTVGRGWFRSPMPGFVETEDKARRYAQPCRLIGCLTMEYGDGTSEVIRTDTDWTVGESPVLFSEIYDGETYDARFETADWQSAEVLDWPKEILIAQEGEAILEVERVGARKVCTTPAGETVIDFGQEVTGYVEFTVNADAGEEVSFLHAEVLDKNGNFYNENYRSAKAKVTYVCRDGLQTYHPRLTFFGFRYIKLVSWPGEAKAEDFTAVVVHSDMRRTGHITTGDPVLNRFLSNVVWGQRGNFLDVPTDCPQRDERLGWTGDAQVFAKTASYFFDVERFFRKWLHDVAADQRANGEVGPVIPDVLPKSPCSAAWGDVAVIVPWQVYQTYGDPAILEEQFDSMKKWVDFITSDVKTSGLWTDHFHYGDWLGLDAPSGSYKGSSRDDMIATAFYAYSTDLLIKAGKVLGRDMTAYEDLHKTIVAAFRKAFPEMKTETEHILSARFGLADDPQKEVDAAVEMIREDGIALRTGFVGTAYLMQTLSDFGYTDLAWSLLLRKEYPGWLYAVGRGATTVWEHWDGIHEDGSFWSSDMNSFNHYAYGAVADWIFERAAGIRHDDAHPGFTELLFEPHPDRRIGWIKASLDTRNGMIEAGWKYTDDGIRIELTTPVPAKVILKDKSFCVEAGQYTFWE